MHSAARDGADIRQVRKEGKYVYLADLYHLYLSIHQHDYCLQPQFCQARKLDNFNGPLSTNRGYCDICVILGHHDHFICICLFDYPLHNRDEPPEGCNKSHSSLDHR